MSAKSEQVKPVPNYVKFIMGGSAGMGATMFVQPLDLVKNRMQLSGEGGSARAYKNSFDAITSIIRNEGVTGIYTGYLHKIDKITKNLLKIFKLKIICRIVASSDIHNCQNGNFPKFIRPFQSKK